MLPIILGATVLGAVGYTVGKILVDDEFRDDVKDKVSDVVCKGYEKMGLNEFTIDQDEIQEDTTNTTNKEAT